MFQRLTIVATTGQYENPQSFFEYEMSSYPTFLFNASLFPRKANKQVLADAIWALIKDAQPTTLPTSGNVHFVLTRCRGSLATRRLASWTHIRRHLFTVHTVRADIQAVLLCLMVTAMGQAQRTVPTSEEVIQVQLFCLSLI